MWCYLKIIGPERGQPPDLYPLHHGISALEIGGGGGVLTTTPGMRSYFTRDRATYVNEISKSNGYKRRSPLARNPCGRMQPCRPPMEGIHPSSSFKASPHPPGGTYPQFYRPFTRNDRYFTGHQRGNIGPTNTNRVPEPHHGNAPLCPLPTEPTSDRDKRNTPAYANATPQRMPEHHGATYATS